MRIAQILYDRAHWIFEKDTQVLPVFPPYTDGTIPLLVDITSQTNIEEGWIYNKEDGTFREPTDSDKEYGIIIKKELTLEEVKADTSSINTTTTMTSEDALLLMEMMLDIQKQLAKLNPTV